MNVLFIYSLGDALSPTKPLATQQQIQFGISYISSFLKQHGHNTNLLVLTRETERSVIDERLRIFQPSLICFTSVATEYGYISNIASYIREYYPYICLLIGGAHVSLNPEDTMQDVFDALCVGEGENPTLELIEQLEKNIQPSGIPNLWIRKGNHIEKNPTRPFIKDIDQLPFPDRKIWIEWIENPGSKCSILLGRGCPFHCAYCCNHALKKLSKGPYVRFRSPENIVAELEEIVTNFPDLKEVYLEVETFGAKIEWALQLCSALERFNDRINKDLYYGVNLRITTKGRYDALFDALRKCKCKFINIGLESGSEKVRRGVLKRDYSNNDIVRAVKLARKYGLKVRFYNMVGLPGETSEDFLKTIKMNRICLPDWHQLTIFFPYPGTDLYFLCKEQGLLKDHSDVEMERFEAILDLPGFSKEQIQKSFIWFDYHAFKGHMPIYKILARVMVNRLHSNLQLNILYRKITRILLFKKLKALLENY